VAGFAFTACISEAISNIDDGFIPRFANNPNNNLEKVHIPSFSLYSILCTNHSSAALHHITPPQILPAVYYLLFTACVIFSFFTLSQVRHNIHAT
jgi:hypothetical protein